jgi:hypothetical protein
MRYSIVAANGLAAVFSAHRTHFMSPDVVPRACEVLSTLCLTRVLFSSPLSCRPSSHRGGAAWGTGPAGHDRRSPWRLPSDSRCVLPRMCSPCPNRFASPNPASQPPCACAVIVTSDALRKDMLSQGLMDAIVERMAAHRSSTDVQLYACWALLELAAGDAGHPLSNLPSSPLPLLLTFSQ